MKKMCTEALVFPLPFPALLYIVFIKFIVSSYINEERWINKMLKIWLAEDETPSINLLNEYYRFNVTNSNEI
jgi:hypothetical protein